MNPVVSVAIITYNHAAHIQRCIESALMQKTSFPFEIVIGEDCSTDGTRQIVFEYSKEYPEIIRVIPSSKNVGYIENVRRTLHSCKGDYIAYCEGDDYWIDPLKLQKQYEAAIKYDSIFVTHNTLKIRIYNGNKQDISLIFYKDNSTYLSPEEIITLNCNIHASSFFFNTDTILKLPHWYFQAPVMDVSLKMILASYGRVYYINEAMSVYQKGTPGSFSSKVYDDNSRLKFIQDYLRMYKNFDNWSKHKYRAAVRERCIDFYKKVISPPDEHSFKDIPVLYKIAFPIILFAARFTPARVYNHIKREVAGYVIDEYFKKP